MRDLDAELRANELKRAAALRDVEFLHKDIEMLNARAAACRDEAERLGATNFDGEAGAQQ